VQRDGTAGQSRRRAVSAARHRGRLVYRVVAEHRESWVSACPLPPLLRTPATPTITAASKISSPRITIMTRSSRGSCQPAAGTPPPTLVPFASESTLPMPFGKQPIQEGLITATDHPAPGCGRGARASRHRGILFTARPSRRSRRAYADGPIPNGRRTQPRYGQGASQGDARSPA
jgi:hypothetical protein